MAVVWVNRVGVALQVVGVLGAIVLLLELRASVTLHESPTGRVLRWIRRVVLRRKPKVSHAAGHGTIGLGGSVTARGVSTNRGIPRWRTVRKQIKYLEQWLRAVEQKHNNLSSEVGNLARSSAQELAQAKSELRQQLSEEIERVRAEFRKTIGDQIWLEIAFLLCVAVGVVLAAL